MCEQQRRARLKTSTTKTGKLVKSTAKVCYCSSTTNNSNDLPVAQTKSLNKISDEIGRIFGSGKLGLLSFAITPSHELRASM